MQGKDAFDLLLERRRLKRTSLRNVNRWDASSITVLVGLIIGGIAVRMSAGSGHAAAAIAIGVLLVAALLAATHALRKSTLAAISRLDDADFERFKELEAAGHTHGTPFAIRRKVALALPVTLSIVFILPLVFATLVGGWSIVGPFEIGCALVIPVIALLAARFHRPVVATFHSTGIELRRNEQVDWRHIRRLDLFQQMYRSSVTERLDLYLDDGREVSIPLTRSVESPAVIFEIADTIWHRVVGDRVRDLALLARHQEIAARLAPFRSLPVEEQRRQISVLVTIFALVGFAIHGIESGFLVATSWLHTSGFIAFALAIATIARLAQRGGMARLRRRRTAGSSMTMLALLALMLALALWSTIGLSWPSLLTRFAGTGRAIETPYAKQEARSGCQTRIVSPLFDARMSPYYCVEPVAYGALASSGTLHVDVRETWFGRHLVRVRTVDPSLHH